MIAHTWRACGRDFAATSHSLIIVHCRIVSEVSSHRLVLTKILLTIIAAIEKMARHFCVSLVISVLITLAHVQGTSSNIYYTIRRVYRIYIYNSYRSHQHELV